MFEVRSKHEFFGEFYFKIMNDRKESQNENEVWKDVVGYEGLYQVSNLGRIRKNSEKEFIF